MEVPEYDRLGETSFPTRGVLLVLQLPLFSSKIKPENVTISFVTGSVGLQDRLR